MLTRLTDEESAVVVTLSPTSSRPYLPCEPPGPECGRWPLGVAGKAGARYRKGP